MPPEAAIPLSVISGYLGSGKTTLINRVIGELGAPGLCVIVNDFGALDIDAEILRRADGLTLTLANGCVCCSAAAGLYDAFEAALNAVPRPARIIMEASGVADPARLNAIARAEPSLEARAVVTVVDCLSIVRDTKDPLRKPDILRQLRAADLILLSKTDLAEATEQSQVRALLADVAPAAPVEPLAGPRLPDALMLAFNTKPNTGGIAIAARHAPEERYESRSFRGGQLHDLDAFLRDVDALVPSVIRLKGIVQVAGAPHHYVVDLAGRRVSLAPLPGHECKTSLLTAIFPRGSGADDAISRLVQRHFRKDARPG